MRITRFALILLVLVAAVASYSVGLYTQDKERQVHNLIAQIEEDRESIHLLQAEVAYLARPQRLQDLSEKHLTLRPPFPEQLYDNVFLLPPADGVNQVANTDVPPRERPEAPL